MNKWINNNKWKWKNGGCPLIPPWWLVLAARNNTVRAPSHMRLRARYRYTSSTLIGGKSGAAGGPSSLLHTTLEEPTEYVCKCKMEVKSAWIPTWHRMERGSMVTWIVFQKPPLGGRRDAKPDDHGTLNAHSRWFILFHHVWGSTWLEVHWNSGPGHRWLYTTL